MTEVVAWVVSTHVTVKINLNQMCFILTTALMMVNISGAGVK
jgi:hypothetical protein